MDIKNVAKCIVKDTAVVVGITAAMTGAAALTAPIIGVPALAGAAFAGTYALTANVTARVSERVIQAANLTKQTAPGKYFLANLAATVSSFGLGLGAAFAVSTGFGLSLSLSAGLGTIALASLTIIVSGIALAVIGGAIALATAAVVLPVAYMIIKRKEERQVALCEFIRNRNQPEFADAVWNLFHQNAQAV